MTPSIRTQVVGAVAVVLALGMGAYLALVDRVVTADKEASVFESTALVARTVASQTDSQVAGLKARLAYFGAEYEVTPADAERRAKALFEADDDVLSLEVWRRGAGGFERRFLFSDPVRLERARLGTSELADARVATPAPLEAAAQAGLVLQNASLAPDVALMRAAVGVAGGLVVVADVRPERLLRAAQGAKAWTISLVDGAGRVLAHPDAAKVIERADLSARPAVAQALKAVVRSGTVSDPSEGGVQVGSFARLEGGLGAVIVEVPRAELTSAVRELFRRSVLFALGAAALGLALGVLLARRIARPLKRLEATMAEVRAGALGAQVPAEGARELRAVGEAFNQMSQDLARQRSELEEQRAQLAQSEKLSVVGELAASIVHEVKNPMVGILGFAQLGQEARTKEEMLEYFGLVEKDAQRANAILKNLLELARPPDVALEPVHLGAVAKETLDLARYHVARAGVKVALEVQPELPTVEGNVGQLKQVLLNLVMNAAQAMASSDTKRLTVVVAREADGVVVQVSDTGPGISPEAQAKLFKPFFTTKKKGEGTGLGLSTSKGLVDGLGGRLKVHSVPGEGATFTVWLPVTTAP